MSFRPFLVQGQDAVVPLPENIKPGQYLLRHEILALHVAPTPEFYVACIQINIGGSGTGAPRDDEVIRLPGGYSQNAPGIQNNVSSSSPSHSRCVLTSLLAFTALRSWRAI
jgi:hypothetical protein